MSQVNVLGNGMWDPLGTTGAGTRPYLFDQWMQFYRIYKVFASRVRIQATCNGGTNKSSVIGIIPLGQNHTFGVTDQLILEEMPYAKWTVMKMGSVGAGYAKLSHYMTTRKLFGEKKGAVEVETGFWGAQGADPADVWYWGIVGYDQGGSNNSVICNVSITYYAALTDRDLTAPSPPS